MKKEEYINHLVQSLKPYDKVYTEEIIRDYEEHFQDGMEHGQTEEEICEFLGDPEEIVCEIREILEDTRNVTNEIGRPFEEIERVIGEKRKTNEDEKNASAGKLTTIHFQCKSADIKVVPSKDALFHVYTEDPDDMKYLEHTWEETSYFGRVKTGKKGTLSGFVESLLGSMTEIILEIPDEIEKLHIESSNGDINLKKIKCENITLKTVNGDMKYKKIRGKTFMCQTINGDITGKHLEAENIYIKTVNGDGKIFLNDQGKTCYVCGKSIIGDIKVNQAVRVNSQEFLDLKDKEGIKVFFESVSGDGIVKVKGEVE